MTPFRSTLVAVDFSEGTREAFRMACSLADEHASCIHVLHVSEPQYVSPEPVYSGQQTLRFDVVERDPSYYEALKVRLRAEYAPHRPLAVQYDTRVGQVEEEILRASEELHADLVVLGTHGRSGLRRLLVGSVAETVLRQAACPVLALRSPDPAREPGEIRVILHPTDFSDRSDDALRYARELAREHGARLVLMHAAFLPIAAEGFVIAPTDVRACRAALDEMCGRLEGRDLKYPIECVVKEGDAVEEILDAAEDLHADLIVMGTHGRTGVGRLLMGSVAEGVLRRAPCSVITVRPALLTHASVEEPRSPVAAS